MGLIDELRKRKDSWYARLEEHRRDAEDLYSISEDKSEEEVEKEIQKNRRKVGVFDFKDREDN